MTQDVMLPPGDWLTFVESMDGGSIYHVEEFKTMLALGGWSGKVVTVRHAGEITAGCLLATKPIPGTGMSISRVAHGILLADSAEDGDLEELLDRLLDATRRARSIFLKLGVKVVLAREGVPDERGLRVQAALGRYGCRQDDAPEWSTLWLDLRRSDDEIIAGMTANGRRDLRAGQRAGINVVERSSLLDLAKFYEMHAHLYKGKGIAVTPEVIFHQGVRHMVESGHAAVFWAMHGETPMSCAVVSLVGTPRFLWGGRDVAATAKTNVPCGQVLQFEIMRTLRERGKRTYDLGGSPSAKLDRSHPNYGVWHFKRSLGGVHVDFVEGYRLVSSRFLARIYDAVFPVYRKAFPVSPYLQRRRGADVT